MLWFSGGLDLLGPELLEGHVVHLHLAGLHHVLLARRGDGDEDLGAVRADVHGEVTAVPRFFRRDARHLFHAALRAEVVRVVHLCVEAVLVLLLVEEGTEDDDLLVGYVDPLQRVVLFVDLQLQRLVPEHLHVQVHLLQVELLLEGHGHVDRILALAHDLHEVAIGLLVQFWAPVHIGLICFVLCQCRASEQAKHDRRDGVEECGTHALGVFKKDDESRR